QHLVEPAPQVVELDPGLLDVLWGRDEDRGQQPVNQAAELRAPPGPLPAARPLRPALEAGEELAAGSHGGVARQALRLYLPPQLPLQPRVSLEAQQCAPVLLGQ